jgi:hypothetical protein
MAKQILSDLNKIIGEFKNNKERLYGVIDNIDELTSSEITSTISAKIENIENNIKKLEENMKIKLEGIENDMNILKEEKEALEKQLEGEDDEDTKNEIEENLEGNENDLKRVNDVKNKLSQISSQIQSFKNTVKSQIRERFNKAKKNALEMKRTYTRANFGYNKSKDSSYRPGGKSHKKSYSSKNRNKRRRKSSKRTPKRKC